MIKGGKQTEIGFLPENWKVKSIKEINTYRNKNINPFQFKDEIFEYYSIPAYQNGELPELTNGKEIQSNKLLFDEGTVVFGKLNPRVEKVWRIGNYSSYRKIGTTEWIAVKPNQEVISDFLYFLEWSVFVMPLAKTLVTGSTPSRQRVDPTSFYKIKIPVPPIPEQREIAYILSTVQKAIEQQDKLIRHTTELKKALLQKLFTEGTKSEKQKQTEIGLGPESWEVVELSDVCEKPQYGFTDSASPKGNAKFLRITDITEFGVNWEDVPFCNCPDYSKYELKDGDIVFARIGATTGKSYLIHNPPKSVYASYLIRVRCKKEVLPEFLIYYFASEQYWKQIDATKGNNLKGGVNGSILSKLLIPKPSLMEQKKIADTFKSIDAKLSLCLKKKQTLSDFFKTLLHELMTGQRRVHEIEFEALKKEYKIEEQPLSVAAEK
jgi:type I restriction enzyme S subunit